MPLRGRSNECAALDAFVESARAGDSRAVVLRGEAGIGKTALLDYLAVRSEGCRVVRAVGIESEMELPFASVHQLSKPLLGGLERLPAPQREALETAFGLSSGDPPDRFFVGLALLSQLSEHAEARPVVCLVDDAQWLDRSSAQVLSFVARRLHAESIVIVLAERDGDAPSEFEGLPELRLRGLSEDRLGRTGHVGDASARWTSQCAAASSPRPMAIRLPCSSSRVGSRPPPWLAAFLSQAGCRCPAESKRATTAGSSCSPVETQHLLRVGGGRSGWRSQRAVAGCHGARHPIDAAAPAEADDLIEVDARVAFRHPLLRSAIYRAASPMERRSAHRALAAATDPRDGPRSSCLAPRPGCARSRRGRGSRARAVGRAGAGSRWSRRGGCIPPARGRADPRSRETGRPRLGRSPGEPRSGGVRRGARAGGGGGGWSS